MRTIREANGASQETFAKALGFHRTYLASIERGERNLSLRSVEKLSGLVGVDPMDLMELMTSGKVAAMPKLDLTPKPQPKAKKKRRTTRRSPDQDGSDGADPIEAAPT